ncbi:MAG TPA: phosphoribosylanthranilate isomerase [Vicinamibacterales bacterium]|nr:phosphoribosylanthranilate isomerase [Vicinamibacterales bacterium]
MTAIKICGITRCEDAELAASLGAWAVGFVLWPRSPRHTSLDRVREIVRVLPASVEPVGVFVDPTVEEVRAAVDAGIRVAQIHGNPPAIAVRMVRAVHLAADGIEPAVPDDTVLLDAHDPVRRGGTGTTIDWQRAAAVARTRRVILAGGLRPDNVGEAITTVRPFAVDVSSGVETRPGIKDHSLIRAFIAAAQAASTQGTYGIERT